MKNISRNRLHVNKETVAMLSNNQLKAVAGGGPSGSQPGISYSCPPPRNGEGVGCVSYQPPTNTVSSMCQNN